MDKELFLRLPSGSGLWNYKHEHHNKHLQVPYDDALMYNPINKKENKAHIVNMKEDKLAFIVEKEIDNNVVNEECERECNILSPKIVKTVTLDFKENTGIDIWYYLIKTIDEMSEIYTEGMIDHARDILKTELTNFVTDYMVHKWLGPKKSRVILSWITGNKHAEIDDVLKIVSGFLSWFLDKNITYEKTKNIEPKLDSETKSKPKIRSKSKEYDYIFYYEKGKYMVKK